MCTTRIGKFPKIHETHSADFSLLLAMLAKVLDVLSFNSLFLVVCFDCKALLPLQMNDRPTDYTILLCFKKLT